MPAPARVVVFRALQLGDMLCAVPALRALRNAWPRADITLIGLPWAKDFVRRIPYVDRFVAFPGFPGLPEIVPEVGKIPEFLARMQAMEFDLAIQMHGSGELSNPLVAAFGARRTAGFFMPDHWCPSPSDFLPWEPQQHEVRRMLALAEFLGAPPHGEHIELPMVDGEHDAYAALQQRLRLVPGSYACIHAGARLASRRWLPERFAAVADELAADGLRIVLTGTAEEAPLIGKVKAAMRAPADDVCGQTTLGTMARLVSDARLVVSNDTGMSHVAAALDTPSVIVCCGADPKRWQPLDAERHPMVWTPVPCRPCAHVTCPTGHECATGIAADWVTGVARRLLATTAPIAARQAERQEA